MKKLLLLIIFGSVSLCVENLIEKISVPKHRIEVTVNKEFKAAYLHDDFFVEYDPRASTLPLLITSIVSLPFLMQVVTTVWASNKEYYIDEMNDEVYESLERLNESFRSSIQKLMERSSYPETTHHLYTSNSFTR